MDDTPFKAIVARGRGKGKLNPRLISRGRGGEEVRKIVRHVGFEKADRKITVELSGFSELEAKELRDAIIWQLIKMRRAAREKRNGMVYKITLD